MQKRIRINRFLSQKGLCSRREADRLILEGRVLVNGSPVRLGMEISPEDEILVDGKGINPLDEERVLLAFNKPRGMVCTSSDKDQAPNIIDYIDYKSRIFTIGRLDKDSQGLILLTNRGELVNKVNKKAGHHEKEYFVRCLIPIGDEFLKKMASGVEIEVPSRTGGVRKVKTGKCKVQKKDRFSFFITICEGYNRQIRRMCQALGNKADIIKRIRIMNIRLGKLEEGKYRHIEGRELENFEKEL